MKGHACPANTSAAHLFHTRSTSDILQVQSMTFKIASRPALAQSLAGTIPCTSYSRSRYGWSMMPIVGSESCNDPIRIRTLTNDSGKSGKTYLLFSDMWLETRAKLSLLMMSGRGRGRGQRAPPQGAIRTKTLSSLSPDRLPLCCTGMLLSDPVDASARKRPVRALDYVWCTLKLCMQQSFWPCSPAVCRPG